MPSRKIKRARWVWMYCGAVHEDTGWVCNARRWHSVPQQHFVFREDGRLLNLWGDSV